MSKKFRIFSILAIIVCLCLSGFIGYRGGHAIGLYTGQIEGFTAGYMDAMKAPITAVEPSMFVSAENSIARRQANQNGIILPLEARAFEPGQYDFELHELEWWTGYDAFRDFFESLDITIGEESELAGWFECQLPEGWYVSYDDTPNYSRDETVHYLMPDGIEAFQIISHKHMSDYAMSLYPNHDLFCFWD